MANGKSADTSFKIPINFLLLLLLLLYISKWQLLFFSSTSPQIMPDQCFSPLLCKIIRSLWIFWSFGRLINGPKNILGIWQEVQNSKTTYYSTDHFSQIKSGLIKALSIIYNDRLTDTARAIMKMTDFNWEEGLCVWSDPGEVRWWRDTMRERHRLRLDQFWLGLMSPKTRWRPPDHFLKTGSFMWNYHTHWCWSVNNKQKQFMYWVDGHPLNQQTPCAMCMAK